MFPGHPYNGLFEDGLAVSTFRHYDIGVDNAVVFLHLMKLVDVEQGQDNPQEQDNTHDVYQTVRGSQSPLETIVGGILINNSQL